MRHLTPARFVFTTASLLGAMLVAAGFAPKAQAAALTYDANTGTAGAQDGAGAGWNTTNTNWWNGADVAWPDTNADEAIFGAGSGAAGMVTVGAVTANKITFNAPGSGNYTLSGGTITLAGTTPTITANANASATINSVLAGTDVTVNSSRLTGLVTLGGANTFTGTLQVNNGAGTGSWDVPNVQLSSTGSLAATSVVIGSGGAAINTPAIFANNAANQMTSAVVSLNASSGGSSYAIWELRGNSQSIVGLQTTGATGNQPIVENSNDSSAYLSNSVLTLTGGGTYTYSGLLRNRSTGASGTLGITMAGTGTQTLSGANSYTGATTVTSGTLNIQGVGTGSTNGNTTSGAQLTTSVIDVSGGALAILDVGAGVKFASANAKTTLNGAGTIRVASGLWYLGNGSGASGGSAVSMSAGGLIDVLSGATLSNDYGNAVWTANQASLNVASGGTMDVRNNNTFVDALTGGGVVTNSAGSNTLTVGVAGGGGTFSGAIQNGTGIALTKTGAGTQILTGGNGYTGATSVTGGTLQIGNGGTTGAISGSSAVSIASGATVQWYRSDTSQLDLANNISSATPGSGTVSLRGDGVADVASQYRFTGTNTAFSGTISLDGGRLNVDNTTDLGTAVVVVNANGQLLVNASATFANNITINDSSGWRDTGNRYGAIRLEGNSNLSGNIVLNQANHVVIGDNSGTNAVIAGYSVGNHVLSGVISGTGDFSMSRYNGNASGQVNISLTGTSSNTYTGTTVVDGQAARANLILAKTGGAVAIVGGTIVQFGSGTNGQANLRMGGNEQFGTDNGGVVVNFVNASGQWGRFDLMGTTQTVAGLNAGTVSTQGGAVIQNREINNSTASSYGGATLTLNGSGTYVYNGLIRDVDGGTVGTDTLSLVKNGTGTQVLAGNAITYTGTTTINAGEIQLASANVGRGDWTINNTGILRGVATDSIDAIRSITVNAGGKVIQSGGSYQQFYNGGAGGTVLILNGGSVEATVAGHANYGNFLLRGNVLVGGSQTSVISADFRMGDNADRTFTVNSTGDASGIDLDITGNFSHFNGVSAGYMTKEGAGTMRFAATSTNQVYRLTVNAGKVLMVDQMSGWSSGIINNAEFEADIGTGLNKTYASQLSGTGNFTKSGAGTLQFNGGGQVITQGNFYITGGKLQNNNNSVNWSTNTGNMHISAGATLDLYADGVTVGGLNGAGTVTNGYGNSGSAEILTVGAGDKSGSFSGVITQTGAGALSGSGVGQGALALIKTGTGIQTLSGANTYKGTTSVNAGTLNVTGTLTSNVSVANGAILEGAGGRTTGTLALAAGSTLIGVGGSGTASAAAGFTATGAVTPTASVKILGTLNAAGTTMDVLGTGTANTAVFTAYDTSAFRGGSAAGAGLSSVGAGGGNFKIIMTTNGATDTWAAGTGTWDTNVSSNWGNNANGNFTGTGAGANDSLYFSGDNVRFTDTGGGGTVTLSTVVTPSSVTFDNSAADYVLSGTGSIAGTTGLTKSGTGTTTLSTANAYTGATAINAGTLEVTTNNALGTTTAGTTVASGATLRLNNVDYTTAEDLTIDGAGVGGTAGALANTGTSTYGGLVTIATGTAATINTGGGTLTLTGGVSKNGSTVTFTGGGTINVNSVISGALANSDLVVDGTTANLNAANTYNGPTVIRNGGVLNANVAGALPTPVRSHLTMDDSGTGSSVLNLGASQEVASLTSSAGSSSITLNAHNLTIGAAAGSTTFDGAISGSGQIIKDGASTQVLSGANTYTGTTTISAGTLLVNGSHNAGAGNYTVAGGGSLGGSGTINTTGSVTVDGQITGGDFGAINTLRIAAANVNLNGTYQADINLTNATGYAVDGSAGDLVSITGDLDLTGGLVFDLQGTNAPPAAGSHYAIKLLEFSGTGTLPDNYTVTGLDLASGQSVVRWGNAYYLVPEPASFALLSLGCLLLLRRPTRRRGRKLAQV